MYRRSTLFGILASACALVAFLPPPAHAQTAIKQSDTSHAITFVLVDSTSHISGLTGATPVVKLSKNGATGSVPAGTVSEVDPTNCPGLYKLVPASADTGTLGVLHMSISATGADPVDKDVQVVAYDPFDPTAAGLSTVNGISTTLTGVNVKLGTPAGASVSADIAALPNATALATGAAVYIGIDAAHSSSGSAFTLTRAQFDTAMAAIQFADSVTPTAPVASGSATIRYYLPGKAATSGNLVATGTVTYDANKVQTSRTYVFNTGLTALTQTSVSATTL